MHEELLACAALPAPTVSLGMLLRPYSLGHELLLIREGNPITLGGQIKPKDLQEAVLICCQTWRESREMHRDFFAGLKIRLWRLRTPGLLKYHFDYELGRFLEYRKMGSLQFPESEIALSGVTVGRYLGAPYLLRLNEWLVRHLRLSEEQAWDYPFGLAKMQYQTYWEQEGGCRIKNVHEVEFERYCEDEDRKESLNQNGGSQCQA